MSIRSRINIPGGTCEFDLPAYYAWQQHAPERRRADLHGWMTTLLPLAEALQVLLGLLRESGTPQRMVAPGGHYQQSLQQGKVYQLMRVRLDGSDGVVPEISGHRLLISIRFMRARRRWPPARHRQRRHLRTRAVRLTRVSDSHRTPRALPDLQAAGGLRRAQPVAAVLQRALPQRRPGRLGQRTLPRARLPHPPTTTARRRATERRAR